MKFACFEADNGLLARVQSSSSVLPDGTYSNGAYLEGLGGGQLACLRLGDPSG